MMKRLLVVECVTLILLLAAYFAFAYYFENHFFSQTKINGINVSNMTTAEVEKAINKEMQSYALTLEERNDQTEQLYGYDINLHVVFDGSIDALLKAQNGLKWPVSIVKQKERQVSTLIEYDEDSLQEKFNALNCTDESKEVQPTNATVSYGESSFQIVPETKGTVIDKDKLYAHVQQAISSLQDSLSLEDTGCYVEATVKSDNEQLKTAMDSMNKMLAAKITYQFGDKTEIVDASKIKSWLTLGDKFQVNLSSDGVKDFVDYLGKTYNTFGKVRTLNTSYGKTVQISGGDYGWWLDRVTEVSQLTDLIKQGAQQQKEPVYFQTAQQYGDDDVGNTYVEINLTAQHLYFYKDGSLVVDSDFVSGNISKGNGTPVGTYPVQYKQRDATLVGEDYATPVSYWMPFNKNIGLHDAPWRSSFGKDIYMTSGSHGCINLPPAVAKKIYENIKRGVAVYVYELPGTENSSSVSTDSSSSID